jgi:hypothetical protein
MIRDCTYDQRWYGLSPASGPEAATILFGPEDSEQLVINCYLDYVSATQSPSSPTRPPIQIFRAHFEVSGRNSDDDLWSIIKQGWARYKQREAD